MAEGLYEFHCRNETVNERKSEDLMDQIEKKIIDIIDEHRDEIIAFGRDIFSHGELGYKEFETAKKFAEKLKELNIRTQENLAITGVKGYLKSGKQDVTVALLGEMDALRIPAHPKSNPQTQAAHCCGHHAQLAGVIGAAIALSVPEISEKLGGQAVFFAVPAEEYGEIAFKNELKREGKIQYGGGKCELIRIGAFDDINVSVTHHTIPGDAILVGSGLNTGFVSKIIRYKGRAAHAANAPEKGVNALNAAAIGLQALAFQRETFKDEDSVRVHPIVTKGGDLVNVVPDKVVVETLVRAGNIPAILDTAKKVDRAFIAGGDAVGAETEIVTLPGYLPVLAEEADEDLYEAALLAAPGKKVRKIGGGYHTGGSTDVGDLQHVQPVLRFTTNGAKGSLHSVDFDIEDEDLDYIVTAKIYALTAYRLLKNGGEKAKTIAANYHPKFSKDEYIQFMDNLTGIEKKEIHTGVQPDYITKKESIAEVRKACRQYAMLYFHFAKTLYEAFGEEKAMELIQKAVFELAIDRSGQVRSKAAEKGVVDFNLEAWRKNWDLPFSGWVRSYGRNCCPYAEIWVKYYEKYPWFKKLAPFYCDIIDTTLIENFSGTLTHRITKNLLKGDEVCEREYFQSADVKNGKFTYGTKVENTFISRQTDTVGDGIVGAGQ